MGQYLLNICAKYLFTAKKLTKMILEAVLPIILVMSKLSFSLLLHVLKITAHKLSYLVSTFKKLAMK